MLTKEFMVQISNAMTKTKEDLSALARENISNYNLEKGITYVPQKPSLKEENFLIYRRTASVPIAWPVVDFTEPGGMRNKNVVSVKGTREINLFVNHWDACLSSRDCYSVLEHRGLSVHFSIDNDGTIYQMCDIADIAQHAKPYNAKSVGVEITNAVELKYQDWYEKNGFGARPIIETQDRVNGVKLGKILGFYPIQLEALKELWKAFHLFFHLPLQTLNGNKATFIHNSCKGFIHHYHINREKQDCYGALDIEQLLKEV